MIKDNYLEKVYAGFLGMNIGIRLGAPVEPTIWTYERIKRTYGDITDYVKDYKNFAADDDVNGPVYFLRALYDEDLKDGLKPQHIANAWLNYSREGIGMFWWGGYGVSTEHTAYLNLKNGMTAPESGSIAQNGKIVAEQIGGQIFIDTWGLVMPSDIKTAADFAMKAASVSHDGEGIYGAGFMAACISKAFDTSNVDEIIDAGLSVIPEDSTYAKITRSVRKFHKNNPDDYALCRQYLEDNWGYDKYTGVCHIIPNAGVCVLSLLYGNGDFNRTVEISTMCGWDTDCNAANVGTIMGVACGIEGIRENYLKPMNDSVVLSGISGYLNILDIPTYAKEIAILGYQLKGLEVPEYLQETFKEDEIYFDFELPGSTHNFRVSDPFYLTIKNTKEKSYKGDRSLAVLFDRMFRGKKSKVFYKPFYRREDFSDERYMPVFSPKAYSNQTVSMMINAERWFGEGLYISPYVRNSTTKEDVIIESFILKDEGWLEINFTIPDLDGAMVDEIGLIIEGNSPSKFKDLGILYIDNFRIFGKADYKIDISKQNEEFQSVTPFSHNHGAWNIENGKLEAMVLDHGEAMTGNYFTKDVLVKGSVTPENGYSHLISLRVQGALRGYYAGLTNENKVGILKNDSGIKVIKEIDYNWEMGKEYTLEFKAENNNISLKVNGEVLIEVEDDSYEYGMVGYAKYSKGRSIFGDMHIIEL